MGRGTGPEMDLQLTVERVGDAQERVDARRALAALDAGNRGLRRAAQVGELPLG